MNKKAKAKAKRIRTEIEMWVVYSEKSNRDDVGTTDTDKNQDLRE
jgi:hypothetical protein